MSNRDRFRPTYCAEAGRPLGRRTPAEAPGGATGESAQTAHRSANSSLLAIDERRVGPRVVVTAAGEVEITSANAFRHALESARETRAAEIWVDLTAITFCDCRGVRTLLDLGAGLREGSRQLVLICPPGPVRRLLALTGADSELEIHSSPAAAARRWRSGNARETRRGAHRQS